MRKNKVKQILSQGGTSTGTMVFEFIPQELQESLLVRGQNS